MDTLRDVMVKKVITIDHDKTAHDAAILMNNHAIGCIIVVKEKSVIGIVTERDLVRKVCAKDLASSKVPLKEIMSSPVITAEPDLPIEVAVQRMFNNKIRRLPIIENNELVGIVTVSDLARYIRTRSLLEKMFE